METQVAEQVSHWGGIHLNDKNPEGDYSGFSRPGWRASTINEMEGFRFPDQLLATHGSAALLTLGNKRIQGGFLSWKFLTGSYDELLSLNRLPAVERFSCECRGLVQWSELWWSFFMSIMKKNSKGHLKKKVV